MKKISILITLLLTIASFSQSNKTTIEDFGQTFTIKNPDLILDKNKTYKIIFDIYTAHKDDGKINPLLNTVARFINMHVETGVPLENLNIVVILHGKATKDVLSSKTYQEIFDKENPNSKLLEVLTNATVETFVCGQSYSYKKYDPITLDKNVKMALSALTVLVKYQSEGYQLITFN